MIWKALSDPTRRSILDLLKRAPQTTGELSQQFGNLSRYAIMKHLGILEKADLITVKREGKFRWNYLNTRPIQQTYQQWVQNLVQLKKLAAQTSGTMDSTNKSITTTTVFVETTIKAKQERVWLALTAEIGQWWKSNFNASSKTKNFVLESRLGGLMYEDTGQNEGLVWGSVIGIDSPSSLQLKGQISPENGGPAISFIHFELEAQTETTVLKVSDTILGNVSKQLEEDLTVSWTQIIEQGLKPYAEKAA